jgi:adenosylcobinamide-phosphate synthase
LNIEIEIKILIALLLDQLLGDPRWFPHPVKFIGWFALVLERVTSKLIPHKRTAGIITAILVITTTGIASLQLLHYSLLIHPVAGEIMGVFLLYTAIAAKDLTRHSNDVSQTLSENNLIAARKKIALFVGRDVSTLNEEQITKAAIESVAESTVDGVIAPIFFAFLAGPAGAMAYKAINTLDSMFGYKNEQYLKFGWASARIDDMANLIPARLTGIMVPLSALVLRLDFKNSIRIFLRDRHNHLSPNSGHPEAAFAGALNLQLGGTNYYFGKKIIKPTIGNPSSQPITYLRIPQANHLMLLSSVFSVLFLKLILG